MANYTRTAAAQAARDKRYAKALHLLKSKRGATAEEIRKTLKTTALNIEFVAKRLGGKLVRIPPANDDDDGVRKRYRIAA
jgi:hypothetical protein